VNQDIDPESTDDFIGNLLRRDRWIERRARELLARQEAEAAGELDVRTLNVT